LVKLDVQLGGSHNKCVSLMLLISFLDEAEKFADDRYAPTNQEILYTRYATNKVTDHLFKIGAELFMVIDVGGQAKYRAAWPRFFDTVGSIIFVASLASYDQMMLEEGFTTKNRMLDALELFSEVVNHELLSSIPVILLMNKLDLAEEKVKSSSVVKHFPDYKRM
jgi:GTPase SAR1 family protein